MLQSQQDLTGTNINYLNQYKVQYGVVVVPVMRWRPTQEDLLSVIEQQYGIE